MCLEVFNTLHDEIPMISEDGNYIFAEHSVIYVIDTTISKCDAKVIMMNTFFNPSTT